MCIYLSIYLSDERCILDIPVEKSQATLDNLLPSEPMDIDHMTSTE